MKQTSVLIVEDESIIALDIQNQLNSLGYEVIGAVRSGQEAIRAAEDERPDLILMDIMLAGTMDGVEAAETIHGMTKCPVVFLTAYSDDDNLSRAQATSPFGYLVKPFGQKDLQAAIETALTRHRSERELERSRDRQKELATRGIAAVRTANKSLAIEVAGRSRAEEELSRQHMLLDCISQAQSRFIADISPSIIYDGLLTDLLLLTNSEYGFIAEVLHDETGAPYARTHSFTNIAWNDELRETFAKHAGEGLEFRNLETLFGAIMTTGSAVISNDPSNDQRSGGLPKGHPPLRAFLGLPINHGDELVGIAGIANRPEGYDEKLASYLEPFLSTCGNLTAAFRSDQCRRQAEEKVVRWAAFAKNNPAPVLRTDLDGKITLINPAGIKLLGRDVTGEVIESVLSSAVGIFSNPTPSNMSSYIEQKLGDAIYLFSYQSDESTQSIYVYGSNITETKRLQELESRAQRLEAAGQIAGQVAHDFNNLLGPLVGYPDLIREELPADHPALQYLEAMENSAVQMAEINQQLLTLGRRGHYPQKPLDLNDVLGQTLKQVTGLPRGVEFLTQTADDLKAIMGGFSQIGRLILNLIVNAIDAMPAGGQITLRTENSTIGDLSGTYGQIPAGEYVVFTVTDAGCGIPEHVLPTIFDPFVTSKTTDSKRGSGLGLSVVDAVINDHGGYIDVNSIPGSGTSFRVYFPVTGETSDEPGLGEIKGGTETVLIVDDDRSQRMVCTQLLEKIGYKVSVKESGETALEFLKANPHDLLLLDMALGEGIDGTEIFRQALQINPEQRAIIMSGLADTDRVQTALNMGAGEFLKKPVTLEVLALAIRAELDRSMESRKASVSEPA